MLLQDPPVVAFPTFMAELELRDFTIQPRGSLAIGPLNIQARSGAVTALLATEELMLKAIADALTDGAAQRQGSLVLDGETLPRVKGRRAVVAYSGQLPKPSRHTVERVLLAAMKAAKVPAGERDATLNKALAALDFGRYLARRTDDLSERAVAKLALAQLLVTRPACVVLEHPFRNVSQHWRPELRLALIEAAPRMGIPFILLTTDVNEALMTASSVAVIQGNQVVQQDSPMAVFKQPASRAVAELTGESNLIEGALVRSGAGFALVETAAGQFSAGLHNDFEPALGERVTLMIRPEALRIERIPADENCLEGQIERVDYFGSIARYWFRAGSLLLKINELNPRFAAPPSNSLYAFADPEDVVALPFTKHPDQ